MADQPQKLRVDPVRATEARFVTDELECTLIFARTIFALAEKVDREIVPSASVSFNWQLAVALRDMLSSSIEAHEKTFGAIPAQASAAMMGSPN